MSDRKRAFEGNGEAPVSKKLKSELTSTNGSSTPALSTDAMIAQKRAEIAAKVAAMKMTKAAPVAPPKPPPVAPSPSPAPTSAAKTPATGTASPAVGTPPVDGPMPSLDDIARRVAEAKRRVAEAQTKLAVKDNPYMSVPPPGKKGNRPPEPSQQGAGLKMAAHPLLLDNTPVAPQSKKDRYKPMQPKFASIKANIRNAPTPPPAPTPVAVTEVKSNPYASGASAAKDTVFEGAPKERVGRSFKFNPKGKYVQLGNQMRQESQLEALKQRIAESARKAGLDSEFETLEKNIKREPPPDVEWWDAALLPNKTYDDLAMGFSALNIRTEDSPVTIYVQHPIPIPAPADKNKVGLKPLKLTTKEQKKMRKQRRQAELQDKRDRIRMGLIPPDPPKVRLANLMKVLTSDAVQDPTRVEARVRREVAMRKHQHEKMNAERKLTDDQRREKIENKKVEEEKRGIYGAVFKVKTLSDPAHRFKVRKNAEQMNLTGLCIFNPAFSIVYVEGAAKFIRTYKRLMLHRIAWTEPARPRGGEDVEIDEGEEGEESNEGNGKGKARAESQGVEGESEVSLEDNACYMIWEGQLRDRAFSSFKPRSCPTEGAAKEALGQKLAGYWDVAKNWKAEEEELLV
ncbi:pre-mRNA processing factor 3-domain-containing protein [Pisolithus croceorrhizus]|nr:pre-mRNA processing factor 3-domain-containing protein [Pisolithus croceorrhizus]KAI6132619.1 pre-mRNA processing factor 3-domain-containing protein [Pisolithus croceorrhizus]KAI6141372.1 pre-mRNA processing factor 3-domain-containing protein [Pisolithus thermaeus]